MSVIGRIEISEYLARHGALDFAAAAGRDVERALDRETLTPRDLAALLSPAARPHLEAMARRARETTLRHFGRVIGLYAPLYLANHCVNGCVYCGYRCENRIPRMKLSPAEAAVEAAALASSGIRHVLLLTGESPRETPVSYLAECVAAVKPHFPAVSIEVQPLTEAEYRELGAAGVGGVTVYQETYDEALYAELHPAGPKRDYRNRLETPDRAARARLRMIGIGALLGLGDWRREAAAAALHARYLEERYPDVEISLSLPRLQPEIGGYVAPHPVDDAAFVQILLAFRLFLPRAGIALSTRERAGFRDRLVGLGVTRLSAGSKTTVGGYAGPTQDSGQFDVADPRTVAEICAAITARGCQPVFKDWEWLAPEEEHERSSGLRNAV